MQKCLTFDTAAPIAVVRYLPPAAPRLPDPAMGLAHPTRHLPPAPAPRQAAHGPAPRRTPAQHVPPPAQGAHACPKAPAAQRAAQHAPLRRHAPARRRPAAAHPAGVRRRRADRGAPPL